MTDAPSPLAAAEAAIDDTDDAEMIALSHAATCASDVSLCRCAVPRAMNISTAGEACRPVTALLLACGQMASVRPLVSHAASEVFAAAMRPTAGSAPGDGEGRRLRLVGRRWDAHGGGLLPDVVLERLLDLAATDGDGKAGGGMRHERKRKRGGEGVTEGADVGGGGGGSGGVGDDDAVHNHGATRALMLLRRAVKREAVAAADEHDEHDVHDTAVASAVIRRMAACLRPCVEGEGEGEGGAGDLRLYATIRLVSSLVTRPDAVISEAAIDVLRPPPPPHVYPYNPPPPPPPPEEEEEEKEDPAPTALLSVLVERALRPSSPAYVAHAALTLILRLCDGSSREEVKKKHTPPPPPPPPRTSSLPSAEATAVDAAAADAGAASTADDDSVWIVALVRAVRMSGLLRWPKPPRQKHSQGRRQPQQQQQQQQQEEEERQHQQREEQHRRGGRHLAAPTPFLGRAGGPGAEDGLRRRAWLVIARLKNKTKTSGLRRTGVEGFEGFEDEEWPVPSWATSRAHAAEALVGLFNGEDDMLVELLEASCGPSLGFSCGGGSDRGARFVPGPHHVFAAALRGLAWDHSVVLDMLLAPGGGSGGGADIREYMLRYLRLAADEPRAFLSACRGGGGSSSEREEEEEEKDGDGGGEEGVDDMKGDGGGDAEATIGCLRRLDEAMSRLAGRGLMPYNPAPLIRRLRAFLAAVQPTRKEEEDDVDDGDE